MTRLPSYFNRIQGRLLTAFMTAFVGTLAIYWVATQSLDGFTTEVTERLEELQHRGGLASDLEAAIVDQIAHGERLMLGVDVEQLVALDSLAAQARQLHAVYADLPGLSDAERNQLDQIRSLHTRLTREFDATAASLQRGGDITEAAGRLRAVEPTVQELRARIRAVKSAELRKVEQASVAFRTATTDRQRLLLILLGVSTAVAIGLAYLTLYTIEKPLNRLVLAANQFGAGDLTVAPNGRMPEEFHVLAGAFTGMAGRIRTIVGETVETANRITASASDLSSVSEEVAASSGEVSTAMVDITNGAEEQALGLRGVDDALKHMQQRASEIDQAADQVRLVSGQIGELAKAKRIDIGRAIGMLLEVREVVRNTAREVSELKRASEKITTFVETIQGIAGQTNLLALNAAIEAARAGDHGRGFGVVADEVRKLADGSGRAADEVATAVRRIRSQIEAVSSTMDAGYAKVAGVEEAAMGAQAAFEEIVAAVALVGGAAACVEAAAEENRKTVGSVEDNVRSVGAAAESHAASAQQVSAAAEEQSAATEELSAASVELLHAAERLKELVSGFRT
ncbi:MAG: methyl-accepting chemotaxis protein [Longimicrobiales bacterium]